MTPFQQAAQAAAEKLLEAAQEIPYGGTKQFVESRRDIILETFAQLEAQLCELQWSLGICSSCGGAIHHHVDEPIYTCQQCGQQCGICGEATTIPKIQNLEAQPDTGDDSLCNVRRLRKEIAELSADNQRLREALHYFKNHFNQNTVSDCDCSSCVELDKNKVVYLIDQALSTPPPSAVDLELQARKSKLADELQGKLERLVGSTGSENLGDLCDRIELWQRKAKALDWYAENESLYHLTVIRAGEWVCYRFDENKFSVRCHPTPLEAIEAAMKGQQ